MRENAKVVGKTTRRKRGGAKWRSARSSWLCTTNTVARKRCVSQFKFWKSGSGLLMRSLGQERSPWRWLGTEKQALSSLNSMSDKSQGCICIFIGYVYGECYGFGWGGTLQGWPDCICVTSATPETTS